MANALIALTLSLLMVSGGRMLMSYRQSKFEGLLSCLVGAGLTASWYWCYPSDFGDLRHSISYSLRRLMERDGPFPALLTALVPAAVAFVLLLLVSRSAHDPKSIRTIVGPLGPVRHPRRLR